MKRIRAKKIAINKVKRRNKRKSKKVKRILNLSILKACFDGCCSVLIWDSEICDYLFNEYTEEDRESIFEVVKQHKEHYEKRGFTFELGDNCSCFNRHNCVEITWCDANNNKSKDFKYRNKDFKKVKKAIKKIIRNSTKMGLVKVELKEKLLNEYGLSDINKIELKNIISVIAVDLREQGYKVFISPITENWRIEWGE